MRLVMVVVALTIVLAALPGCGQCPPNTDLIRCPFKMTGAALAGC